MKHLKVAEARARFGEVLDEAEKGAEVVIERRGVRFRVVADQPEATRTAGQVLFDTLDPDVLSGQWTWKAAPAGLTFSGGRNLRKRR